MGVAASAKEVQEVVKAVNDVIDLLKKLDRERSAVLEVQNLTTSTLRRVSDNHDDGGFAESPSLEILPGQVDVFGSQSSGILSGAKGQVTYDR